jgi:hypothetical protein
MPIARGLRQHSAARGRAGNLQRTQAFAPKRRGDAMTRNSYRDNAMGCLRIASEVTSPTALDSLLQMAQAWMRLHEQSERQDQAETSIPR